MEFLLECLLAIRNVGLVSRGVDEGVLIAVLPARVFIDEVEVGAVRAEENVAWQLVEDRKATLVIFGDLRIGSVANQLVARVHIWAAYDHNVQKSTSFRLVESP